MIRKAKEIDIKMDTIINKSERKTKEKMNPQCNGESDNTEMRNLEK